MGPRFHVDGITVTKINQTVESAVAGATMRINCNPASLFRCRA
jgi:hypothetical protein